MQSMKAGRDFQDLDSIFYFEKSGQKMDSLEYIKILHKILS